MLSEVKTPLFWNDIQNKLYSLTKQLVNLAGEKIDN